MFVAIATAPAVVCLSYLAQNTDTHSCCPKGAPPATVVPTCCIHSPAITSQAVEVPAPTIVLVSVTMEDPAQPISEYEGSVVEYEDTSPPDCSSILRI